MADGWKWEFGFKDLDLTRVAPGLTVTLPGGRVLTEGMKLPRLAEPEDRDA